jgi:hypothetical protein
MAAMTPAIADTTIMARAPLIRHPIIPAPPAMPAVAIALAAGTEAAAMVEEVATAVVAAIRAGPENRNRCVVVPVPQLLLDSF